jgi:hypothetical protein
MTMATGEKTGGLETGKFDAVPMRAFQSFRRGWNISKVRDCPKVCTLSELMIYGGWVDSMSGVRQCPIAFVRVAPMAIAPTAVATWG